MCPPHLPLHPPTRACPHLPPPPTEVPKRKEQRKRRNLMGCSMREGRRNQKMDASSSWLTRQPRHTCLCRVVWRERMAGEGTGGSAWAWAPQFRPGSRAAQHESSMRLLASFLRSTARPAPTHLMMATSFMLTSSSRAAARHRNSSADQPSGPEMSRNTTCAAAAGAGGAGERRAARRTQAHAVHPAVQPAVIHAATATAVRCTCGRREGRQQGRAQGRLAPG